MGTIVVEAAFASRAELEEEVEEEIRAFDKMRQQDKGCLPLTDYEKMLCAQFFLFFVD